MKPGLITTMFMQRANDLTTNLIERHPDVPGLALIYGEAGLGKTKVIPWLAAKHGAAHMRTKKAMSPRWFLEELVRALDNRVAPAYYTQALYGQAKELLGRTLLVIIDEIERAAKKESIIETIRDLHDETGVPFLFFGEVKAISDLIRHPQVFGRMKAHILLAQPLSVEECANVLRQKTDEGIEYSPCAVSYIMAETMGNFRDVITEISIAEKIHENSGISTITAAHMKKAKTGKVEVGPVRAADQKRASA